MIAHLIFSGEPAFPHESNHPEVVSEIEARSPDAVSIVALRSFDVGVEPRHGKAFSAVKQLRGSSPALLRALDAADRYAQVELELRGADDTGEDAVYAVYVFQDVVLGGVGWSGVAGAEVASDRIAFSYGGLRLTVGAAETEVSL